MAPGENEFTIKGTTGRENSIGNGTEIRFHVAEEQEAAGKDSGGGE